MYINKRRFSTRIASIREAYGYECASEMSALMGWDEREWGQLETCEANGIDIPVYIEEICSRLSIDRDWLKPRTYGKVFVHEPGMSGEEYVEQGDLRDHARALRDIGYTIQDDGKVGDGSMAQLAGVSGGLLDKFVNGSRPREYVLKWVRDALLSIPGDVDHRYPTEVGIRRRLESLAAWGYDPDVIAHEAGLTPAAMTRIMAATTNHICPDRKIGQRIVQAFAKLEHVPGNSEYAKSLAEENGWNLPFQYELETIDKTVCKVWKRRTNAGIKPIDGSDEYRNSVLKTEFAELCGLIGSAA